MSLLPFFNENLIEAGCDEAGRGCLSGPVVAAAVILPKDYENKLLNDLKVFTGEYKLRVIKCEKCGNSVKKYSEKYTDVNIALRIVKFFENNEISKVYLLSADADFLPVVNKFNLSHPSKKIVVVIPPGRYSSSFKSKIHITKSHISKSLFS